MAPTTPPPQADESAVASAAQSPKAEAPAAEPSASPLTLTVPTPSIDMILRIMTLTLLILSISLLASNSTTIRVRSEDFSSNSTFSFTADYDDFTATYHFNDVYAYRYALSTAVIGLAYTFLVLISSIQQVKSVISPAHDIQLLFFKFLGDKVIVALLATGVGAAFGATVDLKSNMDQLEDAFEIYLDTTIFSPIVSKFDDFFNRAYIPTIFLLIAFLTSLVSSLLSSLALTKRVT